ncbi:hypothetical protein scyTo_0021829, partial [Scyliorhinus torazame]|nr:hypothetical protein [Scyliorhinus torazame]
DIFLPTPSLTENASSAEGVKPQRAQKGNLSKPPEALTDKEAEGEKQIPERTGSSDIGLRKWNEGAGEPFDLKLSSSECIQPMDTDECAPSAAEDSQATQIEEGASAEAETTLESQLEETRSIRLQLTEESQVQAPRALADDSSEGADDEPEDGFPAGEASSGPKLSDQAAVSPSPYREPLNRLHRNATSQGQGGLPKDILGVKEGIVNKTPIDEAASVPGSQSLDEHATERPPKEEGKGIVPEASLNLEVSQSQTQSVTLHKEAQPKEEEEPMEEEISESSEIVRLKGTFNEGRTSVLANPDSSRPEHPLATGAEYLENKVLYTEEGKASENCEAIGQSPKEDDEPSIAAEQKPVEKLPGSPGKTCLGSPGNQEGSRADSQLLPSPGAEVTDPGKELQAELVIKMQAADQKTFQEQKGLGGQSGAAPGQEVKDLGGQNHQQEVEEFPKPSSLDLSVAPPKPEGTGQLEPDAQTRNKGVIGLQQSEPSVKSLLDSSGEIPFHFTLPKEGDVIQPISTGTPLLTGRLLKQGPRHSTPIELEDRAVATPGNATGASGVAVEESEPRSSSPESLSASASDGKLCLRMRLETPEQEEGNHSALFSLEKPILAGLQTSAAEAVASEAKSQSVFSRVCEVRRETDAKERGEGTAPFRSEPYSLSSTEEETEEAREDLKAWQRQQRAKQKARHHILVTQTPQDEEEVGETPEESMPESSAGKRLAGSTGESEEDAMELDVVTCGQGSAKLWGEPDPEAAERTLEVCATPQAPRPEGEKVTSAHPAERRTVESRARARAAVPRGYSEVPKYPTDFSVAHIATQTSSSAVSSTLQERGKLPSRDAMVQTEGTAGKPQMRSRSTSFHANQEADNRDTDSIHSQVLKLSMISFCDVRF